MATLCLIGMLLFGGVLGQDPASSWLGYAKAVSQNDSTANIITKIEVYWKNPNNPTRDGCRFCPWFGIETSDNYNLIQPVNVWDNSGRADWIVMNEYFQWHPEHDSQSRTVSTSSGDTIYARITYDGPTKNSYLMHVENMRTNDYVETTIDIQTEANKPKSYTIAYFVFEHPWYVITIFFMYNTPTIYTK